MFDRVITADESWILKYDPETKRQCYEWKKPGEVRAKKAHVQIAYDDFSTSKPSVTTLGDQEANCNCCLLC